MGEGGGGLCNCAPMCTCATYSLTQSWSWCRGVRSVVEWVGNPQWQNKRWHIVGLTYKLLTNNFVATQLCVFDYFKLYSCSQRQDIIISLSRAESDLLLNLKCMMFNIQVFQPLITHAHTCASITFSLQSHLPNQPETGQAEMRNRVWACLTSTNCLPGYRAKYKCQRWSLPHRIRFQSVGKHKKNEVSGRVFGDYFFFPSQKWLQSIKLYANFWIKIKWVCPSDNCISWLDCTKVKVLQSLYRTNHMPLSRWHAVNVQ